MDDSKNLMESVEGHRHMLLPLSPEYIEDEHRDYVDRLNEAIEDKRKRYKTIALAGSYGTGKSSILRRFQEEQEKSERKVVSISVLTLGENRLSSRGPAKAFRAKKLEAELQMEITKRLLYSTPPGVLTQSRFRRLQEISKPRQTRWSLGVSLSLVVLSIAFLFLIGFFPKSESFWPAFIVYVVSFIILFTLTWNLFGVVKRMAFDRIGFKGFDLSVSPRSEKYFDEHLDEIEYFFTKTETEIVIFEDLDRFDNPGIFESLCELNGVLNTPGERTVHFIFAMRDSIFSNAVDSSGLRPMQSGQGGVLDGVVRVSVGDERAKLFDVIIPVLPFMTRQSSYEHVVEVFSDFNFEESILRVLAKHVSDMRLLHEIHNEYVVFATVLYRNVGVQSALSPSRLLAMVAYKCMYPDDFERILQGKSFLDDIYGKSREVVNNGRIALSRKLRQNEEKLRIAGSAEEIAQLRGQRLQDHLRVIRERTGDQAHIIQVRFPRTRQPNIAEKTYTFDQFSGINFWSKCDSSKTDLAFQVNPGVNYKLTYQEILEICGSDKFDTPIDEEYAEQLQVENEYLLGFLDQLSNADMKKLSSFSASLPAPKVVTKEINEFKELLQTNSLVGELIDQGLIDQNFSLYASVFPGRELTEKALNYGIHNIQKRKSDYLYQLNAEEIKSLLRVEGDGFLGEEAGMNVSIVDYLSNNDSFKSLIFYNRLMEAPDGYFSFMDAYLNEAEHPEPLLRALASKWSGMLELIASSNTLTEDRKIRFLDQVMPRLKPEVEYENPGEFVEFVSMKPAAFKCLSIENEIQSVSSPTQMMDTLAKLGVVFETLDDLNKTSRELAIKHSMYTLTVANFTTITGNGDLSLDNIKGKSEAAYENCLSNLRIYLNVLSESDRPQNTVKNPQFFLDIVDDLAQTEAGKDLLVGVIEESAPECIANEVSDVDVSILPILARAARISPTVTNLLEYAVAEDEFPESEIKGAALAEWLKQTRKIDVGNSEQQDWQRAAVLSANSVNEELTPEHATDLIRSLELVNPIDPNRLQEAQAVILPELIKENLVPDEINTFGLLYEEPWETVEKALVASKNASTFTNFDFVHDNKLQNVFDSESLPNEIKEKIWLELANGNREPSNGAIQAATNYALVANPETRYEHLVMVADACSDIKKITTLVGLGGRNLTEAELREILGKLDGDWGQLSAVGGNKFTSPTEGVDDSFLHLLRSKNIAKTRRGSNKTTITPL